MRRPNAHARSDKGIPKFTDVQMIERHSTPEPNSGCWLWLGHVNKWGYGRLGKGRPERQAHRFSYSTFKGQIPADVKVLHRCDVPCCVNPDHLFLGSDTDNMRDMAAKGRTRGNAGRQGSDNVRAKLNWAAVAAIRSSAKSISDLAREFGVSRRAIAFVLEGKTWSR